MSSTSMFLGLIQKGISPELPFPSERIDRRRQVLRRDGRIEKRIDEPVLPGTHHELRQLRVAVFIAQKRKFAARHRPAHSVNHVHSAF